jgi:hypothetical protein
MLLLADRNYAAADLLTTLAATGAHLLIRCKNGRRLAMTARLHDGSWLSTIGALTIRVVEARISITTTQGSHTGDYRLLTTLLDPQAHPAAELVQLYHQRWEIETAYLELKSSILGGRVLRARTPDGVQQELYALLIVYQLLRTAMVDATDSRPGLDPDRASFTTALNTARDQIVHAAGIITDTTIDLVGVIGAQVLAHLLPDRRVRVKTRMIKRSNSKYQTRGPTIDRRSYKATTSINIISPDP